MKRDRQDGAILDHFRIINVGFRETFGFLPEPPTLPPGLSHREIVSPQIHKFGPYFFKQGNKQGTSLKNSL